MFPAFRAHFPAFTWADVDTYANHILIRYLNSGIILIALRCILSSMSMSYLRYGFRACYVQYYLPY